VYPVIFIFSFCRSYAFFTRIGQVRRLLQPGTDRMAVVLRFDEGNGDIGTVIEDEIGPFPLTAGGPAPLDEDAAIGEEDLFPQAGTMNWVQMSRSESSFLAVIYFSQF